MSSLHPLVVVVGLVAVLGAGGCSKAEPSQQAMATDAFVDKEERSFRGGGGAAAPAMRAKKAARAEMAMDEAMPAGLAAMAAPAAPSEMASAALSVEGGAAPAAAAAPTRAWFPETFLFAPRVLTDAEGNATIQARVPDRLTTWRVLALAHSRQGAQAGTVTTFPSQLPVSVDIVTPPFLVAGDRIALPVQLANLTDSPQRRPLNVRATGARLEGGSSTQNIPAQGTTSTTLWLQTSAPGTVAIEAGIGDDAVIRSVDVVATGQPRRVELSGTLAAPRILQLSTTDPQGTPIAGSGKLAVRVFPGALAVLRSEQLAAPGRASVDDDGHLMGLSALLPSLSARLGTPVDDKALLRLRRLAAQRLARHALSPSVASATALAGGAVAHDPDSLLGRTGEHLVAFLAREQRPDGTWGGGGGITVQQLLVTTADALVPLQAAATAAGTAAGLGDDARAEARRRATAATIRARGAMERLLPQADDAYTAAAVVMAGAVDDATRVVLQQKIMAAIVTDDDGTRRLAIDEGVVRADGQGPDPVEATARAIMALQDFPAASAVLPDLGAFVLSSYRPGRGFGDGATNRVALLAVAEVFKDPLPQQVTVTVKANDVVIGTEVLQGDRLHDVLTVSGALATLGESVQVSLSSDPPLPGLSFVVGVDWSVPLAPPSAEAGLSLERELPKTLRVGVPVDVTLRAVAPGGQPMTVTLGLPAGVDAVARSLEKLQEGGTIDSFTVVDGTITLQVPARAQGELFVARVQAVPTLAGTVRERQVSVSVGGSEVFMPPMVWRIER
jgi:hypothetical protein